MKIGMVGLSQSGKTTLFNALTGMHVETGFSGQDVHLGMCKVPDVRVEKLSEIFQPKKTTFATVEYMDVAGIAAEGGISADLLGKIRNTDMLLVVVREFESDTVPHPQTTIDPVRDMGVLWTEFLVSDYGIVENRIARLEATKGKPRFTDENQKELEILSRCKEVLDEERPLREMEFKEDEAKMVRGFQFLTRKPLLIVLNIDERHIGSEEKLLEKWTTWREMPRAEVLALAARSEAELLDLDPEEAAMFREELGLTEPALDRIAAASYRLLGYISFFTIGEDECRAWSIPDGTDARTAAGEIHKDIERGFIRAEVVPFEQFMESGTLAGCKKAGTLRLEGKEYVVRDGEIIHYRFSV